MKKNIIFLFFLLGILTFAFNSVDEIKIYSKQVPKNSDFKYKKQVVISSTQLVMREQEFFIKVMLSLK